MSSLQTARLQEPKILYPVLIWVAWAPSLSAEAGSKDCLQSVLTPRRRIVPRLALEILEAELLSVLCQPVPGARSVGKVDSLTLLVIAGPRLSSQVPRAVLIGAIQLLLFGARPIGGSDLELLSNLVYSGVHWVAPSWLVSSFAV